MNELDSLVVVIHQQYVMGRCQPVTRKNIADYLGWSNEQLDRNLARGIEKGWIRELPGGYAV